MALKNEHGKWIDPKGDAIPLKYVQPFDKMQDRLVMKLMRPAEKASEYLAKLKESVFENTEKFFRDAEKLYGMTVKTEGGNKILTDFSHSLKVEFKVLKFIDFDERLKMAKTIIFECIKRWAESSNDNIKLIVEQAFSEEKKGKVDKDRVLALRDLNIKDTEWQRAMVLINDSIKVVGKRTYVKFWKKNEKGQWVTVPLNIADV